MLEKNPSINTQIAELRTAGWKQKRVGLWESPEGSLHTGPHGAWKTMRQLAFIKEATLPIKPCPFCGSAEVKLDHLSESDDWFVSCGGCDVQQIANYSPEEAVCRWNRRATPPSAESAALAEQPEGKR